jgi:hypothetical protein
VAPGARKPGFASSRYLQPVLTHQRSRANRANSEGGWKADGRRMEGGWKADGRRMEGGWKADGRRKAEGGKKMICQSFSLPPSAFSLLDSSFILHPSF